MTKWALVCVVLSAACANKVAPNHATGPDGNIKHAKQLSLDDDGRAEDHGIVTWPGGDRIDWRQIVIPEGKHGSLELEVTYKTPRPGLHVWFDVFDANHKNLTKKDKKQKPSDRRRTVDDAAGTYFVRIYAPSRADAGEYKLAAKFDEIVPVPDFNPIPLPIPQPTKVAAIPQQVCPTFDPADATCTKDKCWDGAPPEWPACAKANTPPPVVTPPTPPPVVVPEGPTKPVVLRVIKVSQDGGDLEVTVGGGSDNGVGKDYKTVRVLMGQSNKTLATGTVVRINKTTTVIRVKLTTDRLGENPNIELAP